eukprot:CAMPEP_0183759336 /NCGR_PEP_ID=MMETSP0739-20130205/7030_1 /TAXON_ID=385413 /ORGANISM="Thalassiosira miniscula, Strain CCMP1093" /LENGTH=75 /DNA_ID=CAMNT_0025997103 /DNA_START=76 /DNA_END=300 /DNA_ORIENTATION=+
MVKLHQKTHDSKNTPSNCGTTRKLPSNNSLGHILRSIHNRNCFWLKELCKEHRPEEWVLEEWELEEWELEEWELE